MSGSGSISGSITQGNLRLAANGDALQGIEVLLLNADNNNIPIAYTYTDANGYYEFANLLPGNYKVYLEITGKKNDNPPSITLTSSAPDKAGVNFKVSSTGVSNDVVSSLISASGKILNAYPNPVKDVLNIPSAIRIKNLILMDAEGNVIPCSFSSYTEIKMDDLSSGLYYLKAESTDNTIMIERIVKE